MTPWLNGAFRGRNQRLLFGETYEDAAIELAAFRRPGRVFSIAGAGSTALALARAGHDVTAIDINPCQIDYARARAAGNPARDGAAERLLAHGRRFLSLVGWTRAKLRTFLSLDDPREQVDYWERFLDSRSVRAVLDTLFAPRLLRLAYAGPFLAGLPADFGIVVRNRLQRGWATHPNKGNPYAWRLLLGERAEASATRAACIHFLCADAADYLETAPPACFDAFALSNITDGAPTAYVERLRAAVHRAARPGAMAVLRSFAEPPSITHSNWAARDRSLLWGIVSVQAAEEF